MVVSVVYNITAKDMHFNYLFYFNSFCLAGNWNKLKDISQGVVEKHFFVNVGNQYFEYDGSM